MRRAALLTAPLLAAALMAASPAAAWLSREGYRVEDRGNGRFEVLASAGQSASESWCAAGAYVTRFLAENPTARIWRVSPPPRRAGEGVTFALSPEGAAASTGLMAVWGAEGAALSAGFAEALCAGTGPMRGLADD